MSSLMPWITVMERSFSLIVVLQKPHCHRHNNCSTTKLFQLSLPDQTKYICLCFITLPSSCQVASLLLRILESTARWKKNCGKKEVSFFLSFFFAGRSQLSSKEKKMFYVRKISSHRVINVRIRVFNNCHSINNINYTLLV